MKLQISCDNFILFIALTESKDMVIVIGKIFCPTRDLTY